MSYLPTFPSGTGQMLWGGFTLNFLPLEGGFISANITQEGLEMQEGGPLAPLARSSAVLCTEDSPALLLPVLEPRSPALHGEAALSTASRPGTRRRDPGFWS